MINFKYPPKEGLVTIIIPTHNRQDLIIETLSSIVNQSYNHIEVVVVDDHSTDNTIDVVKRFIDNGHNNIAILESDGYGGNHARNVGMMNSHGEFISFFDDDDIMCHDFVSARMSYFKDSDIDYVGCDFVHFEGNKDHLICERRLSSIPHNISSHIYHMDLPTQCFLVTRKCVERLGLWNERVKRLQDMAYFHRLFLYEQKGVYVPLTLFMYRIHENTITKTLQNDARLFAYHEIGKEWKRAGKYNDIKNALMLGQYVFLRELWKENKLLFTIQAIKYLPSLTTMFIKVKLLKMNDNQILNGQLC